MSSRTCIPCSSRHCSWRLLRLPHQSSFVSLIVRVGTSSTEFAVHLYDSSSSRELVGEHSIRLFLSFPELLQKLDNDIWRRGEWRAYLGTFEQQYLAMQRPRPCLIHFIWRIRQFESLSTCAQKPWSMMKYVVHTHVGRKNIHALCVCVVYHCFAFFRNPMLLVCYLTYWFKFRIGTSLCDSINIAETLRTAFLLSWIMFYRLLSFL